jgi:hypothetical protein
MGPVSALKPTLLQNRQNSDSQRPDSNTEGLPLAKYTQRSAASARINQRVLIETHCPTELSQNIDVQSRRAYRKLRSLRFDSDAGMEPESRLAPKLLRDRPLGRRSTW